MVAKITVPNSIRRALNYNEQKMKDGKAECIYAHRFLKEANQLNFYEKLNRFQTLIDLNKRAATNTIHISLNFGLEEKIDKEKLAEIACAYMEKIGFGEQPYLVYQHLDAGHPHIHIVSTTIQKGGKRISLHNLGRNQSNTARKEIEVKYHLQKAEDQTKKAIHETTPLNAQKITYGQSATKRGITNVLDVILPQYKYSSLPELNAVLRLYNLAADRGKEGGIIYRQRGLVYRTLDENGNKIGVPIKASSIYNKPTLELLEKRFKDNDLLKQGFKKHIKRAIDWVMINPPKSLETFKHALKNEKISLIIRENEQGIVYGLTYIDHNTKCVFNGSDIGRDYSAKVILEKCGIAQKSALSQIQDGKKSKPISIERLLANDKQHYQDLSKMIDAVIVPADQDLHIPSEMRQRRKKKKRSGS